MTITIVEASNYFRGLLLLIRKDRKTTQSEGELVRRVGKSLGFDREFCDNAINEILENPHILDEVPCFTERELAEKFLRDGMALAFADEEAHPDEEKWLRMTAEKNRLAPEFFSREWANARARKGLPTRLEVEQITVSPGTRGQNRMNM